MDSKPCYLDDIEALKTMGVQTRAAQALNYLAETDEQMAHAGVAVDAMKYLFEAEKGRVFLSTEGTVDERKAQVASSNDAMLIIARDNWLDAIHMRDTLKARRFLAEKHWDTWRSVNSQMKHGKIL